MKNLIVFIFLISSGACMVRKTVTTTNYDGQKVLMVNNVSLFGGISLDSSESKNKKGVVKLIYKQDTLYSIISSYNNEKKQSVYNVSFNSKKISLSSESKYPRYVNVDTIIFLAGQCYWKRIYYDYNLMNSNRQWAGKTTFSHYFYKDNALLRKDDNFFREDSVIALMPLSRYVNIKAQTEPAKVADYHTLESGITQKNSELLFFRKYIMQK
ncbi:MAG: hypothetical protein NTW29_18635 [Bacteroidetes bacterium]|nr:hypothetical protein [Bacteroidota bacterium]